MTVELRTGELRTVEVRSDSAPQRVSPQPLLLGEVAREAHIALEAIVEDVARLVTEQSPRPSIGLLSEYSLLLATASPILGDPALESLADRSLDEVAERFSEGAGNASLFGGYPGVAMAVAEVERLLGSPASEEDSCSAVDEALHHLVSSQASFKHYDLISGLCGYATYLLSRPGGPHVEGGVRGIVDHLEAASQEVESGITWLTPPESLPAWQRKEAPNGYYNLGVAHGVPGLVPVLAHAISLGLNSSKAMALLEGAVAWILDQRQDQETYGSQFVGWTHASKKTGFSRLAWCYGDAGVGMALLNAALWVGRDDWIQDALGILRLSTQRYGESAGVQDPSLCHGAAGLGHIFRLAFEVSGESVFASASIHWFRKTLTMRRPGFAVGGFWYYEPMRAAADGTWEPVDDPVIPRANLLEGSVGVGLALAAALSTKASRWDDRLLLSQGIRENSSRA